MKKILTLSVLVTAIAMAALLPSMAHHVAIFRDADPVGGFVSSDLH